MGMQRVGQRSLGVCDVCAGTYKLRELRPLIENQRVTHILACPRCWVPDHPQNRAGHVPVRDEESLRNPRPDNYRAEFKSISWAWNPVAGFNSEAVLGSVFVADDAIVVTPPPPPPPPPPPNPTPTPTPDPTPPPNPTPTPPPVVLQLDLSVVENSQYVELV